MSVTDRQRQFKRFNPDNKCCQCMCGTKYRVDVLDTTFTWNDPGGSTETNIDQQRWNWFGGLIKTKYPLIARREWEFNWKVTHVRTIPSFPFSISSSTQRNVLLGVCLVPVIVLKNGSFYIPQAEENFDPSCNVIGNAPGDFGAGYGEGGTFSSLPVHEGGGFRHTQNFFAYFGGLEGSETKCEFIIPIDNAWQEIDYSIADFVLWIDASGRLRSEDSFSINFSKSQADIIIENNFEIKDFTKKLERFCRLL